MTQIKSNQAGALHTDTERLDWMISNSSARCEFTTNDRTAYMTAWVCNGALGNESYGGGKFTTSGSTHRECIDKFLSGDIQRID